MTVLNLRDFKLAKIYVKDIEDIIKLIDASAKQLIPYVRYKPISKILTEMRANRSILESHLRKYKRLIESKGRMD